LNTQQGTDLFGDPMPNNAGLIERLRRFAHLTEQKRAIEASLRPIQDELTELEQPLLEDMVLAGMQSTRLGDMLLYKQTEFHCSTKEGVSKEELIEAFRKCGLVRAIGPQHQTIRSLAKEWAENGEGVPDLLAAVLNIGEHFRLRAKKG
jgi:hypothetical protein